MNLDDVVARTLKTSLDGIASLVRSTSRLAAPLAFVVVACAIMIASEFALSGSMFANPFNWFHLP